MFVRVACTVILNHAYYDGLFFRVACAVIFKYYDYYEYFCSGGVRGYFKSRLLRRVVSFGWRARFFNYYYYYE